MGQPAPIPSVTLSIKLIPPIQPADTAPRTPVTLSRGSKIIYSKKSWREGKVVQWNPKGSKSAHRSGVLEFDPMLYLNTKTSTYDKKVHAKRTSRSCGTAQNRSGRLPVSSPLR